MVRARNRRELGSSPEEIQAGPGGRTSRREQRIDYVLQRRQPSLSVVLEDVHDEHNASAVLRSCDAVGVLDVHLVYVYETPPKRSFGRTTSASATKWIRTHFHQSIEACYAALRAEKYMIAATALQDESRDLYSLDLTEPTALVFGNEMRGVSEAGIEGADCTVYIPMQGMVESLNISVSCAVTLYEAMRQRNVAGMYESPQLTDAQFDVVKADWLRK